MSADPLILERPIRAVRRQLSFPDRQPREPRMSAIIPTDPRGPAAPSTLPSCELLQVAARLAQQVEAVACRDFPLRPTLLSVLLVVDSSPGIRQGECADILRHDATTFGRYVERLVEGGYLRRSSSDSDRRVVRLALTPDGMAAVAHCRPRLAEVEARTRAMLGAASLDDLLALLVRFLQAYDHPLPTSGPVEKLSGD